METTIIDGCYIGILDRKTEATILCLQGTLRKGLRVWDLDALGWA